MLTDRQTGTNTYNHKPGVINSSENIMPSRKCNGQTNRTKPICVINIIFVVGGGGGGDIK